MRKPQIGSVSTATLRTEDLMPAFADELSIMEMSETGVKLLREVEQFLGAPEDSFLLCPSFGTLPDWESEKADTLTNELADALNEYAPPHMWFGAHEGDGADFGWWPTDFDNCERADERHDKNGEVEFVDLDCNVYVHINDHGNVAVYTTDTVADGTGSYRIYRGELIWDSV